MTTGSKNWKQNLKNIWPLFPAAIYLITFLILVFFYLLRIAFTTSGSFAVFEPMQELLSDREFLSALQNSIVFVIIGTPLELIVGFLLAMLVFRAFGAKSFVRSLFTIPFALPGLIVAIFLFILFDTEGGFINHLLQGEYSFFPKVIDHDINWRGSKEFALGISLLGKVWRDMPISMLIILSGLNAIDPSILDAAKTLGAGFRVRLWRIIIPLTFPAITTVLLLRSIEMWKEFIFPYILARRYNLLGTLIESLFGQNSDFYKAQAAVVALVLVIMVVITLYILFVALKVIKNWFVDRGQHA